MEEGVRDLLRESMRRINDEVDKYGDSIRGDYLEHVSRVADVIFPGPGELFIDIDSPEDLATFYENFSLLNELLRRMLGIDEMAEISRVSDSMGGHGQHIVVKLPIYVDDTTRIALQAVLGSDRKREMFGVMRVLNKGDKPTAFFEKKRSQKKTRMLIKGKEE